MYNVFKPTKNQTKIKETTIYIEWLYGWMSMAHTHSPTWPLNCILLMCWIFAVACNHQNNKHTQKTTLYNLHANSFSVQYSSVQFSDDWTACKNRPFDWKRVKWERISFLCQSDSFFSRSSFGISKIKIKVYVSAGLFNISYIFVGETI